MKSIIFIIKKRYDSTHVGFHRCGVSIEKSCCGGHLVVDGQKISVFAEKDPANIPWAKVGLSLKPVLKTY